MKHMKFNWVEGKKMNFEVEVAEYEFYTQQEHILTPFEYLIFFFKMIY